MTIFHIIFEKEKAIYCIWPGIVQPPVNAG